MDFGGNTSPADLVSHACQLFECTFFHSAFSFVMDNNRALFRLFIGMAANLDQSVDNPVESIHVIIVDYELLDVGLYGFIQNFQLCICERLDRKSVV